jgi:deoxyribonuclease-4
VVLVTCKAEEKDEHEHIGQGEIGNDGFERFINHDQLYDIPMVVETPDNEKGGEWNIQKVKDLRDR